MRLKNISMYMLLSYTQTNGQLKTGDNNKLWNIDQLSSLVLGGSLAEKARRPAEDRKRGIFLLNLKAKCNVLLLICLNFSLQSYSQFNQMLPCDVDVNLKYTSINSFNDSMTRVRYNICVDTCRDNNMMHLVSHGGSININIELINKDSQTHAFLFLVEDEYIFSFKMYKGMYASGTPLKVNFSDGHGLERFLPPRSTSNYIISPDYEDISQIVIGEVYTIQAKYKQKCGEKVEMKYTNELHFRFVY